MEKRWSMRRLMFFLPFGLSVLLARGAFLLYDKGTINAVGLYISYVVALLVGIVICDTYRMWPFRKWNT